MARNTERVRDKGVRRQTTVDAKKLREQVEYFRAIRFDPHNINTAVYVALSVILNCLSPCEKKTNASKRKR